MILIDDAKYSCIECIRGHRSSLCRHHTRPLLQVRSKGRPNVHANGNPNHRIAVFAEEVDENDSNCTGKDKGVCENKKTPVVILKASQKQVIDLNNGRIIGPYQEDIIIDESSKPPLPLISSNSFINTKSCCLNGISKPKKSCGCCSNKMNKNINKLKILKTYLKKRMKPENESDFVDYVNLKEIKKECDDENQLRDDRHSIVIDNDIHKGNGKINPASDSLVYDVIKIPSCSIPGSCGCDSNCACEGCFVHGNFNMNELNNNQFSNLINYANNNDIRMPQDIMSNYANKLSDMSHGQIDNGISKGSTNPGAVMNNVFANNVLDATNSVINANSHSHLDCVQNGDLFTSSSNGTSTNLAQTSDMSMLNGQMYNLQTDLSQQQHTNQNHPPRLMQEPLQGYGQEQPPGGSLTEKDIESNVCSCSNDCDCFNCETHGIINGMKLDDLFDHMMPADYKDLISSIGADRSSNNISNILTVTLAIDTSSENISSNSSENLHADLTVPKSSSCCRR